MPAAIANAEDLVRSREARGLYWSLVARLTFIGIFTTLVIGHLLGVVRPGVAAQGDADAWGTLGIELVAIASMLYFLYLAARQKQLVVAGVGAAVLDVALVSLIPVVWALTVQTPDGTLSILVKNEFFAMCVGFVVVNALAMRPLYPLIATGGFVLLHVALTAIVVSDERVVISQSFMDHFYTSAVNPGVSVLRIIILALVGGFLAFLAHSARRTIRDAVALEIANAEIKEQQAERILEGKLVALADLVAGVAHELNTPLGVTRGRLDITEKVVSKLSSENGEAGRQAELATLGTESIDAARAAVDRIANVVSSLKDFARLDQSETKPVDLHDGIESTLALVAPEVLGETQVVKDFAPIPSLVCRPKEINQIFMTVIVNALEAMQGQGELRIATAVEKAHVQVRIADTGPGIPTEALASLFELSFHSKAGRMTMGLGLPTARRIAERHAGRLEVESVLGEGSVFTLSLPLDKS